jgi:hypothetical protein
LAALGIALVAMVAVFRFRLGVTVVLVASCVAGAVLHLLHLA